MKQILSNLAGATQALNVTVRENRQSIRNILTTVERITNRSDSELASILNNVDKSTYDIRQLLAKTDSGLGRSSANHR